MAGRKLIIGVNSLPGGGMTNSEDKRQEDRREKDRRNQERRKKDRRFAFYYKLVNFLLGSLGLMIIAWAYIFWVY